MLRKKIEEVSILSHLWASTLDALKSVGVIQDRVDRSLEKYKRSFQKSMVEVAVMGLSIFMCVAFLVLGLFFIVIDYGGIPRGIVFVGGGLVGFLVLRLMVPAAK
jgi:hypothetical protein